jgi:hypothetical protein
MWTGQRDEPDAAGRRFSQLYIARTAMERPPGLDLSARAARTGAEFSAPVADALASVSPEARAFGEHATILASPFMQGRFPGTVGIERAEAYIADRFESLDLAPAFGRGPEASFFQPFEFVLQTREGGEGEQASPLQARNVAAILKGRGELASRFVVIGAHHDHLGFGEQGSLEGAGELHEGADDNASGTAGVLLAAEILTRRYAQLPPSADARSIIFTTFSAEEVGLNGSRFFVDNPPRPIEQIDLMMNFDMIGRVTGDRVSVSGAGTSAALAEALDDASARSPLNVERPDGLIARSDHAAFYDAQIPVLFFSITPFHADYHTPRDESWRLNRRGGALIVGLAADIAASAAQRFGEFEFSEVEGFDQETRPSMGDMPVRFGIMPGNYNDMNPGIEVERVSPGGSADAAGVRAGDRLMKWNGEPITSISVWMELMSAHQPGDVVEVAVSRDGQMVTIPVELQEAAR